MATILFTNIRGKKTDLEEKPFAYEKPFMENLRNRYKQKNKTVVKTGWLDYIQNIFNFKQWRSNPNKINTMIKFMNYKIELAQNIKQYNSYYDDNVFNINNNIYCIEYLVNSYKNDMVKHSSVSKRHLSLSLNRIKSKQSIKGIFDRFANNSISSKSLRSNTSKNKSTSKNKNKSKFNGFVDNSILSPNKKDKLANAKIKHKISFDFDNPYNKGNGYILLTPTPAVLEYKDKSCFFESICLVIKDKTFVDLVEIIEQYITDDKLANRIKVFTKMYNLSLKYKTNIEDINPPFTSYPLYFDNKTQIITTIEMYHHNTELPIFDEIFDMRNLLKTLNVQIIILDKYTKTIDKYVYKLENPTSYIILYADFTTNYHNREYKPVVYVTNYTGYNKKTQTYLGKNIEYRSIFTNKTLPPDIKKLYDSYIYPEPKYNINDMEPTPYELSFFEPNLINFVPEQAEPEQVDFVPEQVDFVPEQANFVPEQVNN